MGVAFVAALLLTACGYSQAARERSVTVFAAASLTEAFGEIAERFRQHTGTQVHLSFGPSDGLAAQLREGAPADVFAPASIDEMDAVERSRGVEQRTTFARNRLVLVVPARNAAGIRSLADVTNAGVKLVVAGAVVPAGRYARRALDRAGIAAAAMRNVVSNEDSVKGVVQKVALDEADAGIVYGTDVTEAVADRIRAIDIPDAVDTMAAYPIAVLADAEHTDAARAFVAFVLGAGKPILERHGFLAT